MIRKYSLMLSLGLLVLLLAAACTPGGAPTETTPPAMDIALTLPPAPTDAPAEAATDTPATEPTATAEGTPASPVTADDFIATLQEAVAARDFATLQGLMADPFTVGYWLSEGVSYTPAEAAAFLESNVLPAGAQIVWADPDMDLAPMLQGQPPASFLGPDKEVAAAMLSYGWGEDASAEAIHFIARQPDGTFRWELMLYSGFGFMGLPTDVEAVVINADEATFYSGPGDTYDPVATVFGGMTYPVIGASQDQMWWRLRCYDDNNELIPQCWVSADPAVSAPSTLP